MPAVLRLLLATCAALALLAQPVTTWAAAGVQGEARCCCPDPKTCECHDHGRTAPESSRLKRCGNADVQVVTPVLVVAVVPAPPMVLIAPQAVAMPAPAPVLTPDAPVLEIDTPPF